MQDYSTIAARIARVTPSLSATHKRMAEYILNNPFQAATMRIDEFANAVRASVATANRFARALEFDGYPQFRSELARSCEAFFYASPPKHEALSTAASTFGASLDQAHHAIAVMRRAVDAESCERAVQSIVSAARIYIVGFGSASFLSGLLQHELEPHCRAVVTVSAAGDGSHAERQLSKLDAADLLIAIALPNCPPHTITLARRAKEGGVPLLALTDQPTSPIAPLADIALYAPAPRPLLVSANTPVLALIEALCNAIAQRTQPAANMNLGFERRPLRGVS